jgi:protein-S-isoprenylcysteine O-methyltransferase Ste14
MLVAGAVGGIIGGALPHRFHAHPSQTVVRLFHFTPAMLVAVLLIAFFSIVWSAFANDSAPTRSSESTSSRQFHVGILNLSVLVLLLSVPGLTRRFLPASAILSAAGLVLESAGILFAIWARRHLGSNWSGEVRIAAGHQLVRTGPYARIRHPIYTGFLAMYGGAMLVSGEVHALLAFAVIALLYLRKLRLEENLFSETFGEEFSAWRRKSWFLMPPLY